MTKVRLTRDGRWFTVEADGHAAKVNPDGSVDGSREVCFAVSVIMQTLHTWLVWSKANISDAKIESGSSRLRFSGFGCETAFNVAYCGFRRLAGTNPDCIQYEINVPEGTGARSR